MKLKLSFAFASALLLVLSCTGTKEEPKPNPNPSDQKPVIKAQPFSVDAAAGVYVLPVTVENPVQGKSLTATLVPPQDNALPDWVTVGEATSEGIPVTVKDNLSDGRQVLVKLSYPDATDVEVLVTQSKWNYPAFSITMTELGPFGATFQIDRKAGYSDGYFFEVLDKPVYEKYVEGETHKFGDFAYGDKLYQSDLDYLKKMAQKHGHSLSMLFGMLGNMYSKDPQTVMPYSGLDIDTDYVFLVYGMEESDAATRKTPICVYEFHTGISSSSELSFYGQASDVTESSAQISVSPSDNTEYWYLDWASDIQLTSTTPATLMQNAINNAKTLINRGYSVNDVLCLGKDSFPADDLMPGTEYTVFAWGMDPTALTATTEPQEVFKFRTKDIDIVDDCKFEVQVLEIEDMDILVKVTPSNLDTRYYVAFVAKSKMVGYSDEQAAQRIINMESGRIKNHEYDVENLSWANLPGLLPGVREIWGRRDEGWDFQPSHDYRIYVFGIDNMGIRTTKVEALDVTTAEPGVSNNHFEVTIDSNTWKGLYYTVTPEIEDDYWLPFVAETSDIDTYFRNADGSLKEKELFEWVEEYYENEITSTARRGTKQLYQHVTPDTNYTILIFGYAGTYTTKMYEWPVYVPKPPLDKSTADFSYTYELFRGEDLTALNDQLFPAADFAGDCVMVLRLTPTDNAVHWYFGCWNPVESYAEQGGQYYLMTLDMNPDVPGSAMQDKRFFRNRPWWYGSGENYQWVDDAGDTVNHWPWSLSGWAEDADGNYGPWHYELFIPVPVPKDTPGLGKYEVGYTEAYDFWSAPAQTAEMKIFSVNDGREISIKNTK